MDTTLDSETTLALETTTTTTTATTTETPPPAPVKRPRRKLTEEERVAARIAREERAIWRRLAREGLERAEALDDFAAEWRGDRMVRAVLAPCRRREAV